jgi:hypothetical protein
MKNWKVTWIEGDKLRQGVLYCDFYSIATMVSNIGCHNTWTIISVEVVPEVA